MGGLVGIYVRLPPQWIGVIMAFGAGVLISAVAYELVGEAVDTAAGGGGVPLGLAGGALTFFAGDALIERLGAQHGEPAARPRADLRCRSCSGPCWTGSPRPPYSA
jgi:ZIP family zinc transporter